MAADQQDQVIGMIHVCPPLSWIDDHPMVMRPALGQTVTELGMLAELTKQQRETYFALLEPHEDTG
ncbi:hypothetical protein ACJ7VE_06970 [Streptomyces sp. PB17]|uniref:hypothetical protein n=1 Tax=Streptomyces sp. PB17 TaxID=3384158 RepID=UPI0038B59B78